MVATQRVRGTQAAVVRRPWTRAEYEQLIEHSIIGPEDRVELVAGEILKVTPQKGPHAKAVGLGQDALLGVIGGGFHLRVQLPLALGDDSEPEPDLAVIPGKRRDQPTENHPQSAVLVVEVSDTTLAFDRTWKTGMYARAGIPEYWIINLVNRFLEVYRDPAPDDAAFLGYAYRTRLTFGPDDRVSLLAIPDAVIAVGDLLP